MGHSNKNFVLLTGSTGALGSYLLKSLLSETKDVIFLLIRDKKDSKLRINNILKCFFNFDLDETFIKDRLRILNGDITRQYLGLNIKDYRYLCRYLNRIYHCAAQTNLRYSLDNISSQNIGGTNNIIKLAKDCKQLNSLNYISTMFLAGDFKGTFTENSFFVGQRFNNSYEESKFEAEKLIRNNFNSQYSTFIYRPSVIMGAYSSGAILKPSNLYFTIYLFRNKIFDFAPVSLSTRHNIIPVDLAANAICLLSRNESGNFIFNICTPQNIPLVEFLEQAAKFFKYDNPKFIPFKRFPFDQLSAAQKMLLSPMISYLNFHGRFDADITNRKLKSLGFRWKVLDHQYFCRVFKYIKNNNRPINAIS